MQFLWLVWLIDFYILQIHPMSNDSFFGFAPQCNWNILLIILSSTVVIRRLPMMFSDGLG